MLKFLLLSILNSQTSVQSSALLINIQLRWLSCKWLAVSVYMHYICCDILCCCSNMLRLFLEEFCRNVSLSGCQILTPIWRLLFLVELFLRLVGLVEIIYINKISWISWVSQGFWMWLLIESKITTFYYSTKWISKHWAAGLIKFFLGVSVTFCSGCIKIHMST